MSPQVGDPDTVLARADRVHEGWMRQFRTPQRQVVIDEFFRRLLRELALPPDTLVLDAGCGSCSHTVRLARCGMRCLGIDFSAFALRRGRDYVRECGLSERIWLARASLLDLPLRDASVPAVLCWGVLMHIPRLERAVEELARVLVPGGLIVISEANMHSLQYTVIRLLRRVGLWRRGSPQEVTPRGVEGWTETPDGAYLTRQARVGYYRRLLEQHGIRVIARRGTRFTTLDTNAPSALVRRLALWINTQWMFTLRIPWLAVDGLLIGRKSAS